MAWRSWAGHSGHFGGFGRRGGFRGHSFRSARHRWHHIFAPPQQQPDPQIQWAQGCLAQSDPSVPQDGIMGPQTQQAIRTFQSQQQLPPSGMLDPNTITALQTACSGAQGGDSAPPAGSGGPPPGGASSGHHKSHEIGAQQEGEFPGAYRFRREERFREEERDRHRWDRVIGGPSLKPRQATRPKVRIGFAARSMTGGGGTTTGSGDGRSSKRRRATPLKARIGFAARSTTGGGGIGTGAATAFLRSGRGQRSPRRELASPRGARPARAWDAWSRAAMAVLRSGGGQPPQGENWFRREEHDRRRLERDWRQRPFFEAEAGSAPQGENWFRREEHDRRRWDRDRERHRPFFEAETGNAGEGEVLRVERSAPRGFAPRPQERFWRDRVGPGPERRWFFNLPENRRIGWAQSCLAQTLGPWVVQDGVMGPNTAGALRTFQERQQLPVTGVLDESTVDALHAACGR